MSDLTISDAYKIGFEDGLKAGRNKPEAYWIKKKVDKRHYHYVCNHCKAVSKYKKTPYCPMCGYLMLNSEMKEKE